MKNKQSKGLSLSLSVNPKHSISERFKAFTHGFCHFLKKFKDKWNTPLIVILGHTLNVILGFIPRIYIKYLENVILGFIPRIRTKQNLNRHPRAWLLARPEDLDTRDTPEYDEKKEADITTFENDHTRSLIKGLKCIKTAESGVDSA